MTQPVIEHHSPDAAVGDDLPRRWTFRQLYTLGFLTLIAAFNYLDRSLLGLALPHIKAEMHLSDTVLGLITGLAFSIVYAVVGVPIAALADRKSRRNIIAAGYFFWSLMAAFTGIVANVWHLAAARFMMGAGEACAVPPSNSMVGDLFPVSQRPTALAVLGTGVAISSIVFYPIAGWIGQVYGWRAMFHVAGTAGIILAAIFLLTVKEPVRGSFEHSARLGEKAPPFTTTLHFLSRQRAYVLLIGSTVFEGAQISGDGAWTATLLTRVHHMSFTEVGFTLGTIKGALSTIGILACGLLTDRLGRRDSRWRIWTPAAIGLIFAPAKAVFLLSDSQTVWFGAFCVCSFLSFGAQSAILAALLSVAPLRARAVAISLMIVCSSLLAQLMGPLLIGYLSDTLEPRFGDEALRYAMLTIVGCIVVGSIFVFAAARTYADDVARAKAAG